MRIADGFQSSCGEMIRLTIINNWIALAELVKIEL
jgi:hypothetical protein